VDTEPAISDLLENVSARNGLYRLWSQDSYIQADSKGSPKLLALLVQTQRVDPGRCSELILQNEQLGNG
jgi:hypothetical protein